MALDINSVFGQLQSIGVYDFLLPFLLVFTIIFAILEKTRLMGTDQNQKPKTNINTILALIIGLIVVVQTPIIQVMNNYLSKMALFIVIILIFLLVLGIFGANVEGGITGGVTGFFVLVVAILAVLWALSPELGFNDIFNRYLPRDSDRGLMLFIVIFIVVVWLVTRQPGEAKDESIWARMGNEVFNRGRKGH